MSNIIIINTQKIKKNQLNNMNLSKLILTQVNLIQKYKKNQNMLNKKYKFENNN